MNAAAKADAKRVRRRTDREKDVPQRNATTRDVTHRAYELFVARGCEHGHDLDDWLTAEREVSRQGHREG